VALDTPVVAADARRLASCRGAIMLGVSPGFVPVGNSAGLGRRRSFVPEQHFCWGEPNGQAAWAGGCAT
jgi:hypothetical protein